MAKKVNKHAAISINKNMSLGLELVDLKLNGEKVSQEISNLKSRITILESVIISVQAALALQDTEIKRLRRAQTQGPPATINQTFG